MQYLAVRSGAVAVRFFVGLVGFVCMFLISPNFFSSLSSVFLAWKNVPLGLYVIPATVNHTEVFATFLSQVSPEYQLKHLSEICTLLQHKNQMVNEELWKEVQTYGDIQLMPFVDYYSLITWKTIAICIFGVIFHLLLVTKKVYHMCSFPLFNRLKLFRPSM